MRITTVALTTLTLAGAAAAHEIEFLDVPLNGDLVVLPDDPDPPSGSGSDATGIANLILDEDTADFTFDLEVFGIFPDELDNTHGGNNSAIHIHAGGPTERGPIIIDVQWFALNEPGGFLTETADGFIMHAEGRVTSVQGNHDTGFSTPEIFEFIENSTSYITVHDFRFPTGAIRGNFIVPTPSSLALLAIGAVATTRRRR